MNAQSIYRYLTEEELPEGRYLSLSREFYADNHSAWEEGKNRPQLKSERKNKWDRIRRKMETEMETCVMRRQNVGGETWFVQESRLRKRLEYKKERRKINHRRRLR